MTNYRILEFYFSLYNNEQERGYWKFNSSLVECNDNKSQTYTFVRGGCQ